MLTAYTTLRFYTTWTQTGSWGRQKADVPEFRRTIKNARTQRRLRFQLLQQRLRFLQILCVEAFCEPVVDWIEQFAGFSALAQRVPEAGEAG